MRKCISLMSIAVLLFGMGLSATASQTTQAGTGIVKAGYVAGEAGEQIISVDLAWEGMEFTYHGASERVWDPEKHEYTEAEAAAWAESAAFLSITNHSNVILQAGIDYSSHAGYEDMGMTFAHVDPYIGSAETSDDEGEACKIIIRAIPMGKLKPNTPYGTDVGEIKVTVTPVDSHALVLENLGGICKDVPVKSEETLLRGERYYATAEDKSEMLARYAAADAAVAAADSTIAQKNLAVNQWLAAYYNKLYLMQE